MAVVNVS